MSFLPLDAPARAGAFQLVATLGPASLPLAARLAEAGATSFRLNASHLDAPRLSDALARVSQVCPDAPIVVDLQGAKMRIDLPEPLRVSEGDLIRLSPRADGGVVIPHDELFLQARVGDTVSVDDGRVRFEVVHRERGRLDARALNDGMLLPRKGVNIEEHPVHADGLTARDAEAVEVASSCGVSALAFSFMLDGREAGWLAAACPGCRVIGKVERREALAHLDRIAGAVDAVWICRGDLGAQLGLGRLAREIGALSPRRYPVPVLMAGEVLEHLTSHQAPTRSEVCHLFDLAERGFAGIVLSDETAIGRHPVHAVATAAALLASFRS